MEDRSTSFRELVWALKRGSRTLIVTMVVVVLLIGALSLLIAPRYESQASVQILSPEPAGGLLQDLSPLAALGLTGLGGGQIDTDMTVMRSRRVVEEVIDSLALHIDVLAPDTLRETVLQVTGSTADAVAGRYKLRRTPDGRFELRSAKVRTPSGRYTRSMARVREIVRPPATILPGQPFEMGGMTLTITPPPDADNVVLRVRQFQPFVKRVRERDLKVRRTERGQIIHMDFRHRDPALAAAAVNGIARSFLDYKLSTRTTESRSRVEILTAEVASYDSQIRELERRLQSFQERELIIAPEEQATQQVRRVAEMQVRRDAAIVERQALTRILNEIANAPGNDGESPYRRLATFPSFISNGAIQNILHSLITLEDARAGLLARRQPSNDDVQVLTDRIEDLEQQLHRLARDYAASLESQIASTETSLAAFSGVIAGIPRQEIEFARLTRERMLLSEIYVTLQERLKEAEVLATIEAATGSVRILDNGLVPEKPVFPNLPVNLGLGAILGLLVGMMIVVARESASTRLWSKADADEIGLTVPVLAAIPRMRPAMANGRGAGRWVRLASNGRASALGGHSPLVTKVLPASEAADAFRALRSTIVFNDSDSRPQVVTLTSVTRGEENSLGAANLALTLAQQGSKTLLIDSDLRGARLHEILRTPRSPGLAEVALGSENLADAIRSIDSGAFGAPLDFLPAGTVPENSADFLTMARTEQLIAHLRTLYEAIIIEAPPSDALADAALLGRLSDTTIVVARAGVADGPEVEDTVEQLRRLGVTVGGLVLIDV